MNTEDTGVEENTKYKIAEDETFLNFGERLYQKHVKKNKKALKHSAQKGPAPNTKEETFTPEILTKSKKFVI